MRRRRIVGPLAASLVGIGLLAACGSGGGGASGGTHGTASVAYADSLQLLYSSVLQPGFEHATGDSVTGRGAGSTTLAQEIVSGEITPGVFVSVGRKAMKKLWSAHKSRFLIEMATNPLVVMYNPHSSYAPELEAISKGQRPISDLFTLLQTPGIRIGRTDPNADPQGVFFLLMFELAQHALGLGFDPASTILGVRASQPFGKQSQIVDATALVSDLQAGEFDLTSGYVTQAVQAKLPYVSLPASLDFADPAQADSYKTVSVTLTDGTVDDGTLITLDATLVAPPTGAGAPTGADLAADDAFLAYLLSPAGRTALKDGGYTLQGPTFTGAAAADTPQSTLPADVLQAL